MQVLILTSCVLNVILMQLELIFNCSNLINGSVNKKSKLWPSSCTDMHSKQLQAAVRLEFMCLKAEFNLRMEDKMPKCPKDTGMVFALGMLQYWWEKSGI